MIKLMYFARLRESLGAADEQLPVPPGVTDLGALRAHLAARGGAWAEAFASQGNLRMAVNQELATAATPVKAGDEVAFFPPVTGG